MSHVIGIDIGTQSLKGILLDGGGTLVAEASASYDVAFPRPGWAEQDPADWLAAMATVIPALLDQARIKPEDVGTIGFDTQVDGVVAIGTDQAPLRPAIIWMDRRAEAQTAALGRKLDPDRVFDITGLNLDSSHVAPKILWLREEEPSVFRQAEALLLPGSYLVHHLTGERVVDYSNASSSMLYDVRHRAWSSEMLMAAELEPSRLGRIAPAYEVAGTLTPSAALELGLSTATKVVVGCGDEHAACLGAGLVVPNLVCDITGTAEPVAATASEPMFDATRLVETHAHADPRLWLIENPGFVSGGSVRWHTEKFARVDYETLDETADRITAGSEGLIFLPCLSGAMTPTWNGNARGVFFGLSMMHGPEHTARAVYEGCAYGFRDIVDRFDAIGIASTEVRVVGGGTKSRLWCQIKADVTGRVLRTLRNPETAALGAAMLAAVAEGTFGSLDDAADQLVEFGEIYEPRADRKALYDDSYQLYRELYATLEPLFDRAAG